MIPMQIYSRFYYLNSMKARFKYFYHIYYINLHFNTLNFVDCFGSQNLYGIFDIVILNLICSLDHFLILIVLILF